MKRPSLSDLAAIALLLWWLWLGHDAGAVRAEMHETEASGE